MFQQRSLLLFACLIAHLHSFASAVDGEYYNGVTRRPGSRYRYSLPSLTTPVEEEVTTNAPVVADDIEVPFECEQEGFFPNPKDCRKYFWCLDSGPAQLGIVAHAFTCPSGLYFNTRSEACDYPQNTNCKQKGGHVTNKPKGRSRKPTTTTTTTTTTPRPPPTTTPAVIAETTPVITAELVARALELAKAEENRGGYSRRPKDPELRKLLDLIASMGGIEHVENILTPKHSRNEVHHNRLSYETSRNTASTPNFYEPSYETPKRQDNSIYTTTEKPTSRDSDDGSRRANRPRRPQFDRDFTPTVAVDLFPTTGEFYNPRGNGPLNSQPPVAPSVEPNFNFVYNSPERVNLRATQPPPVEPTRNTTVDGFFVYNNPGRRQPSNTINTPVTEEPSRKPQSFSPPNTRIRVVSGPLRESNGNAGIIRRRPNRVHFNHVERKPAPDSREQPSNRDIYNHQPAKPATSELNDNDRNRKPIRRRPPQRTHLHSNHREETPTPTNAPRHYPNERPSYITNAPFTEQPIFPTHSPVPTIFRGPQSTQFSPVTPPPTTNYAPSTPSSIPYRGPIANEYPVNRPYYEVPSSGLINRPYINPFIPNLEKATTTTTTTTTSTTTPRPAPVAIPVVPHSFTDPNSYRAGPIRRPGGVNRSRRPYSAYSTPDTYSQPRRPTRPTTTTPAPAPVRTEESYIPNPDLPAVTINNGELYCNKRGVHPHPSSCSQYVVCAPNRKTNALKLYSHHCPAEQVFVKQVGRCRPGDRDQC